MVPEGTPQGVHHEKGTEMHQCRTCGYRFENEQDLNRHEEEGRGCPEAGGGRGEA